MAVVDDRNDLIALYVQIDPFPRAPFTVVQIVAAIEVDRRLCSSAPHDMHKVDVRGQVVAGVGVVKLVVGSHDVEARHLMDLLYIVQERLCGVLVCHVRLQDLAFEFKEERRLVIAKFGLDPVLRIQEDLAVCFPDPIVLHPLPLLPAVVGGRVELRRARHLDARLFQSEQAALDEHLD